MLINLEFVQFLRISLQTLALWEAHMKWGLSETLGRYCIWRCRLSILTPASSPFHFARPWAESLPTLPVECDPGGKQSISSPKGAVKAEDIKYLSGSSSLTFSFLTNYFQASKGMQRATPLSVCGTLWSQWNWFHSWPQPLTWLHCSSHLNSPSLILFVCKMSIIITVPTY